jgi:hypothetical protein
VAAVAVVASKRPELSILVDEAAVEVTAVVVVGAVVMTRTVRSAAARSRRMADLREAAAAVSANAHQRAPTLSV